MDNQARDYAQQHLETLACNDARARLHAAKELSWMTGDDSRHLGLVEGTIEANRKAVFDEVLCLTRSHRAAADRAAAERAPAFGRTGSKFWST